MTDSRIIYWCETHDAESIENAGGSSDECWRIVWVDDDRDEAWLGLDAGFCRTVQMRLVPLEVSEEMVEAAAKAIKRQQRSSSPWRTWVGAARAALNAALGGNDASR